MDVRFENETFWLTLQQITDLFQRDKSVISRHLKKIFYDHELVRDSVVAKNATTASDGKTYLVDFYNLDVILSVGYRVNAKQGVLFRQWATARLKEYLVKGYSINQKRLDEQEMEIKHIKAGISIIHRSIIQHAHNLHEAQSLVALLEAFSSGLTLLDDYDHQSLDQNGKTNLQATGISTTLPLKKKQQCSYI